MGAPTSSATPAARGRHSIAGVQCSDAMRTRLLALAAVAALVVVVTLGLAHRAPLPLPPVDLGVEEACVEAMKRPPDHTWVVPGRQDPIGGGELGEIQVASLGMLLVHGGDLVRVAGFLHSEFEWNALYPSREAAAEHLPAPWVALGSLWPDEPYWKTRSPSISGRCVVVEGRYVGGPGGHFGSFVGRIDDILRLDVWSTPHRPIETTLPPPPPLSPPTTPVRERQEP